MLDWGLKYAFVFMLHAALTYIGYNQLVFPSDTKITFSFPAILKMRRYN